MNPPDMDKLPEYWYVVNRGADVGIFADRYASLCLHAFNVLTSKTSRCADFVVSGVSGGHKVKVKSWHEAATWYNELYRQGNIVRVPW